MKPTLLEKTRSLMESTPLPVVKICREANVNRQWYYKVLSGEIPGPDVNKIERLYSYLRKAS